MVIIAYLLTCSIAIENNDNLVAGMAIAILQLPNQQIPSFREVFTLKRAKHLIILDHIITINQDIPFHNAFPLDAWWDPIDRALCVSSFSNGTGVHSPARSA